MFTFPHALHISPPPPSKCTECSLLFLKCRTERSRDRTASRSSTTAKANHSVFLSARHIHPKSHELRLGVLCLRQQSVSLTLQQVTDQTTVFVTGGSVVTSLTDTSLTAELKQYVCSYTCIKKKRKKQFKKKQNTDVRVLTNSMQVKHTREHTGLWPAVSILSIYKRGRGPSLPAFWSRASARAVFIDVRGNQYYIRHFVCCRVQPIARDDARPFGRRHK